MYGKTRRMCFVDTRIQLLSLRYSAETLLLLADYLSKSRRSSRLSRHDSLAYAEEAIHVHDSGHLSDLEIARTTGAAPSTVRELLARRSSPSGARAERLVELSSLVERLGR